MFRKFSQDDTERFDETVRNEVHRGLYCSACRSFITDPRSSLAIHGSQRHTRTNPAQLTFTIGCFKEASGCRETGVPTEEHSWFPGYRWRIALCANCGKHLGWSFLGAVDRFYGLIVNALFEK